MTAHDGPRGHGETCSPACPACAEMRPPERKPAAGWIEGADGQWRLRADSIVAHVVPGTDGGGAVWRGQVGASNGTDRASFVFSIVWERSLAAAQLAAEDALLEVLQAGASALGYEVRRG